MDIPSVTVIGKPSAKLANQLEADTKARLEETKKKFGPEGLKQLEEKLHAAQEKNDKPYPDEFLSDFPIPDVESIDWIEVETARTDGKLDSNLQKVIDQKDPTALPFCVEFDRTSVPNLTLR